jgi:hypothetical protein
MGKEEYSYKKKKIFKRLHKSTKIVTMILSNSFNSSEIEVILKDTINGVESLLPEVPFIGGKENISLNDFFDAIMMLALFKELRKRKVSVRDIGQIMYEIRELQTQSASKIYKNLMARFMFSSYIKRSYRKKVEKMTEKNYSENWNMEFVEGDGEEFDWGMNYTDCAVHKFYKKHGGEELLPYVCMSDYAIFHGLKNVEFVRTQTLSGGASYCDFRFKKGGSTPRGWPPEELPDFKIKEKEVV